MSERKTIGIVGLGALGEPLALNALAAGHEVWCFDVRMEAMKELELRGARCASDAAEVAARCEVVLVAVATGRQLETVVLGGEGARGLVSGARQGTVLVVHSTVGSETCRRVDDLAKESGIEIVDAPVTGPDSAPESARRREMTYILGGRPETLDRIREVLALSGSTMFRVGGVGDAQNVKVAANALALVQMQATYETMRLLMACGLADADATALLSASSASNWAVEHWPVIARAASAPGDPAAIPRKDLELASRAAEERGTRLDLAEHVRDRITEPGLGFLARPDRPEVQAGG